jgi:hypothetical protein
MKRQQRKPQFNFEATKELIRELKEVALFTQIPASHIIREAVSEKIVQIKRTHPRYQIESVRVEVSK